jgi:hypothetical protein
MKNVRLKRVKYQGFIVLAVVVVASTVVLVFVVTADNTAQRPQTLRKLVAKNYRELSASQSQHLVLYARAEYRCLVRNGAKVTEPVSWPTRITMHVPNKTAREIVKLQMQCDHEVGPPPANATLQARAEQILVYLPKWCLLHPSELPNA